MHKTHSSHLLPVPTDIEETNEALSAVNCEQVRQNLLVNYLEKTIVMFSRNNNLQFLAQLMGFTLTDIQISTEVFPPTIKQFLDSLCATCIFLTGQ